jgi:hypothetical protein
MKNETAAFGAHNELGPSIYNKIWPVLPQQPSLYYFSIDV